MNVMICENDNQGRKSGKVYQVGFYAPDGEQMLLVEPLNMEGEPINITVEWRIKICDRIFKCNPTQWWAGNMLWNEYEVPDNYALGLINTLRDSKKWTVNEAWTEIYEAWQKPNELAGELFELTDIRPYWINEQQTELPL